MSYYDPGDKIINLPVANVNRIMKSVLPDNAKIAKETKHLMQDYSSDFISFVTADAVEKMKKNNRKTITGEDVIMSIRSLGFRDFVHPLEAYFSTIKDDADLLKTLN